MKLLLTLGVLSLFLHSMVCPPVTSKKPGSPNDHEPEQPEGDLSEYMEYHRYLQEVVQALESDPEFREKLTKAEEVDIRSGKIAHELEYVNHNVRTKLDELKRQELERLRHLATKQFELSNDIDTEHLKIKEHLDHTNEHTFEVEDLKKLILKTTADLAEADKKRREEFKEYEMQKEFEKQEKLKTMDEEHRKEYEKQIHEQEEKHKKHEPLHHPGSKQQLEEVWEKQDHMENQNFDPRTFFMLHDLDGNGVWDQDEVKALFLKELDKLYQSGVPEDDMRERAEEMERMREHVFGEADTDRDGLISYKEFLAQTQKDEFQRDPGWDSLDKQQVYTHEEYQAFERRRQEEIQKMIQQGMLPPHPYGYPGQMPHPGQFPPQGHPNYQNMHPGQQPMMHPGQQPPMHPGQQMQPGQQQMHPGQQPPMHPGQQQQMHPGQQPPMHPGQQQQMHPGQQPPMHPGQQPPMHPGQQQMMHPGQQPPMHPGQQQQMHPGQQYPNQGQQQMMHPGQQYPNQGQQFPNQGQQFLNQGQQFPNQGQQFPNQGQEQHPNAIPNQVQQINENSISQGDQHPNAIPNQGQQQLSNNIGNQPQPPPNSNQQHLNTNIKDSNSIPNHVQNDLANEIPQVDNHISQSKEHIASINVKNAAHVGTA